MAVNISHYLSQLEEMENPYFVTLTLPTCTAKELPERIKYFEATWRKIYKRSHEKRVKEINEKDIRLNGVRSMECTLRPDDMYHYHMHLIVEGKTNAEWLVQKWIKINKRANGEAQDFREINKGEILVVFKFILKSLVNVHNKKEEYRKLDIMFQALNGKRLFSSFGRIKELNKIYY